jgi:hypothetical protein
VHISRRAGHGPPRAASRHQRRGVDVAVSLSFASNVTLPASTAIPRWRTTPRTSSAWLAEHLGHRSCTTSRPGFQPSQCNDHFP